MVELTLIFSGVLLVQMILYEVHLGMLAFFRTRFFGEALEPYKILRNIFDLVFIVFVWILAIGYYAKIARDLGYPESLAMVPFSLFGGYAIWRGKNSKDPTRKPQKRLKIAQAEIHTSFWQTPGLYLKEWWHVKKERDPFVRVFYDVPKSIKVVWVIYWGNWVWIMAEIVSLFARRKFIFFASIIENDGVSEWRYHPVVLLVSFSIVTVGYFVFLYQFYKMNKKIKSRYGIYE